MSSLAQNPARRAFIARAAASGFLVAFGDAFATTPSAHATSAATSLNGWISVAPDGVVTLLSNTSEIGQGTGTALAQILANELDLDWHAVKIDMAPVTPAFVNAKWREYATYGSGGVAGQFSPLRQAAAKARSVLISAAAAQWKVAAEECDTDLGFVVHASSGRRLPYADLAQAASHLPLPAQVALMPRERWRYIGRDAARFDIPAKVDGSAVYGIDVKRPGMLTATLVQSPSFGGRLADVDAAPAMRVRGVRHVVKLDDAVAVVADNYWSAKKGLAALKPIWDNSQASKHNSADYAVALAAGVRDGGTVFARRDSSAEKEMASFTEAMRSARKTMEQLYMVPFLSHATMEPMNATALYTADKCEVWCGTQNGEAAFAAVLEASGLPASKCDVHKQLVGSGFGRRGQTDYVRQAVEIAKQMPGTPVKLIWSREEDMTHGRYHPITQCKMVGGFDADNNLTALHMRISGQSILFSLRPEALVNGKDPAAFAGLNPSGEAAFGYSVPNLLIEHSMRNPHIIPGFWRGVNVNHNAIYLECFMDELAQAAGQDPLEFRRKLMTKHPKNLAVLNAVAEKIGWGKPAPQGVYRGLAHLHAYASYVAGAAEISVTDGNKIKVLRIVAATDPGYAVNPAQIERQIAGSFVYGLSGLFYGGCTVKDGAIEQTNFDTYNSMRIAEMPKVESIVMPSGGFWGGVGEPTIGVAAPAVLNAYFAATGKRIRSIPLRDHNISFA